MMKCNSLLGQEGWLCHQTILPKATFERHGRGGHSGLTTPSALSQVALQRFLDAQPPLLSQEGNIRFAIRNIATKISN